MADERFDLCECIWNHELATQRLLAILRQSQNYCTETECFLPGSRDVQESSDFFTTCLIIAFGIIMYVLRPNSLRRLRNDNAKDSDNRRDSNDDPPAPPPTAF
ncbi:small integral membrane protein 14 [Hylaeus anthracinus]|uniref:small integral membrane protein 14 n=1 Tax=Hylaeus anthracinus TaxID=313031 RepID=UPI0023B92A9F|nr:small integral membrane protein 14 [Hylaeus anthracinus]XP_054009002.1 small integral membrane protein 14 [Hylaeus anthracinus]XP_054009003.1 small integral membrane protein 14 [Hylaeus anthracinus]